MLKASNQQLLWLLLLSCSLFILLTSILSISSTLSKGEFQSFLKVPKEPRRFSNVPGFPPQSTYSDNHDNPANNGRVSSALECSTELLDSDPFLHKLCEVEFSYVFFNPRSKPLVTAKDTSPSRYYAQRDLQGWTMAYTNISFEVSEISYRTSVKLSKLAVFLCFGNHAIDVHCIKPAAYQTLNQGQKFNQIHGFRNTLWRKDAFCFTLRESLESYRGRKNFTFPCWVLPKDQEAVRKTMDAKKGEWIVKPSSLGEGHGIFIVGSYKELQNHSNVYGYVVQPLLVDPYLVNGRKFDFRTYVLVTSISPLRVYIYKEGLVRFSASKYKRNGTHGRREDEILTNTSVGKKYTHLANLTWTYARLRAHFTKVGVDADKVFQAIYDAIVKTFLAAEFRFMRDSTTFLGGYDCGQCFQLMGVDVILDSNLKPIVIEMNGLPSMQLSHDLGAPPDPTDPYAATKFGLMHDTLQILFQPTSVARDLARDLETLRVGIKPGPLCSQEKHIFCVDHKDLQKLLDSKREYVNKGGYLRIYPSASGEKYSKLIRHMDAFIRSHNLYADREVRTLWQTHYLYAALEKLYALDS